MAFNAKFRLATGAGLMAVLLLAGCKSDEQKALDLAKAQAAASNAAQQIQYIDKNGDTVTTTVQPPVAGQAQQVTTSITPPPPGPPPARTRPVVTAIGPGVPATQTAVVGQPALVDQTTGTTPANSASSNTIVSGQTAIPAPVSLTLPAGTDLAIRINQHISVKHAHAGDRFSGEVVEPISREGTVVIPRGTPVSGRIDEAHRRGHFKGRSILELRLTSMTLNGSPYALDTHDAVRTKKGKGKRTAGWISGMTGAGMLIGGIASGGVGLAIGAASGAGAGTLIAGTTGNRDVEIPAESIVHFRLADQLVVQHP